MTTSNKDNDMVNHPPHYKAHPSGVEAIDIVEHLSFNLGNATKYLWRRDHKGRENEDTRKALWYLERELERLHHVTDIPPVPPSLHRAISRVVEAEPDTNSLVRVLNRIHGMQCDWGLESMIEAVEFMIAAVREDLRCGR